MSALLMSARISRTLFSCTSIKVNRKDAGWEGERAVRGSSTAKRGPRTTGS